MKFIKKLLYLSLLPLTSCSHGDELKNLCSNGSNQIQHHSKETSILKSSRNISSFVAENKAYINYDLKEILKNYKQLNSDNMQLKVLEELSSDQGFSDGVVYNPNFKEDYNHMSVLKVSSAHQGRNSYYYESDNFVPLDKNIVMNIKKFIDDQIFLMNQNKIDESKLNAFISEFLKKGRCQGGDELGMVVVESNFDGVHLILETNPEWFLGQGEVKSFAYSVYYTKATDGKYENTIYNKVDVQY